MWSESTEQKQTNHQIDRSKKQNIHTCKYMHTHKHTAEFWVCLNCFTFLFLFIEMLRKIIKTINQQYKTKQKTLYTQLHKECYIIRIARFKIQPRK